MLLSQDEFIDLITQCGIDVRLSRVWLSEVYRLVVTYDILSKAGYRVDSNETNRSLIGILSENIYTQHPCRLNDSSDLSPVKNDLSLPSPSKKEGTKFARRLLLSTWDQILDILAVPLDITKIVGMNVYVMFQHNTCVLYTCALQICFFSILVLFVFPLYTCIFIRVVYIYLFRYICSLYLWSLYLRSLYLGSLYLFSLYLCSLYLCSLYFIIKQFQFYS